MGGWLIHMCYFIAYINSLRLFFMIAPLVALNVNRKKEKQSENKRQQQQQGRRIFTDHRLRLCPLAIWLPAQPNGILLRLDDGTDE